MKTAGTVLLILGIIGLVVFGIQAIGDSESFQFLGMEFAMSSANWTPVIISVVILIVGIIMNRSAKTA
jgi:uncharacterized membrane protein